MKDNIPQHDMQGKNDKTSKLCFGAVGGAILDRETSEPVDQKVQNSSLERIDSRGKPITMGTKMFGQGNKIRIVVLLSILL